ncbi:MAG: hypothetical protein ACHQD9_01205 [Chitinophagales bacterium]
MMQTITWDKFGYYLYLPTFFYDDPGKVNNFQHLIHTYNPGGDYQAMKAPNGNFIMKYSSGMAVMYLPGFIVGHVAASLFNYPVDGMSLPYQVALNFESLLIAILGLVLLRKILKKFFFDQIVAAVLFIIGFASNYFQYAAYDNLFQHVYLFTLYCVIILLSIEWNQRPKYFISILLGLSCGLATLTRPTEIVTALIPLLWGVYDRNSFAKKFQMLKTNAGMIISFASAAILIGSVQLIYWKIYAGQWLYFSYGEGQTFSWLHPHVCDVLFSYRKGWFTYTPVMILSVLGMLTLFFKQRFFFWFVIIFMIFYFYPVAAWDNWDYGGSFSMRAMIQSYPVLAFSIASLVEFVSAKRILKVITVIFVLLCTWLNVVFSWQAYYSPQGIYDGATMTNQYYWRVFGKFRIDVNDKRLMDTNEEMPKSLEPKLSQIYFNDLEKTNLNTDTLRAFSGKHSFLINDSIQNSPAITIPVQQDKSSWYRFEAKIFCPNTEWDIWKQTQMIISLQQDGQEAKTKMIRVYRIIKTGEWQDVYVDINGISKKPYNQMKIYFWNATGSNPVFIDDIRVLHAQE